MKTKQKTFSVIIPTYARPIMLKSCLRSLARIDYPREDFEVVVVDDGSTTPLDSIVNPFRGSLDLVLLTQPNQGPATARNNGAMKAKGRFLAFTDDDCEPAPDWLLSLAGRMHKAPGNAVGGRTINILTDNRYAAASQMLVDYLYRYYNKDHNRAVFFTSNNLCLPADLFWSVGGFDTTFPLPAAEDRELCARWLRQGYTMIYAPEVLVRHSHRMTYGSFCRQHFRYGRGAFHFHRRRADAENEATGIEPLRFYLDLLSYPFSQPGLLRPLTLASLLFVSQTANAAGFFLEALSEKKVYGKHRGA